MAQVDSIKQGSFKPSGLRPGDTISSITNEGRAAHELPNFEATDPTRPTLYLPPLLSKHPQTYEKDDKESHKLHSHPTEPGPLHNQNAFSIHRLGVSFSAPKFKAVDDKYASTPYGISFNWAQLELPEDKERHWYCVAFRSRRKPGSDSGRASFSPYCFSESWLASLALYEQDRLAHGEAVQNGGVSASDLLTNTFIAPYVLV